MRDGEESQSSRGRSKAAAGNQLRKVDTNSIGMRLTLILAGEFMMGSDATDPDAENDEFLDAAAGKKEKHLVRIT